VLSENTDQDNAVIADSVRLAQCILRHISPHENAFVRTITKSDQETVLTPGKNRPIAFGYTADSAPKHLEREGVIDQKEQAEWYTGIDRAFDKRPNILTLYGREKKYITEKQEVRTICADNIEYPHTFTFWTTRQKLISFVKKYEKYIVPTKVSNAGLITYRDDILSFPIPGEEHPEQVNFKGSNILKALMWSLWELRKRNPGKTLFTTTEIAELYNSQPHERDLNLRYNGGNLKGKVTNNRPNLQARFTFDYDRPSGKWRFEVK